ncbi:MAG TPA: lytic transglycosylase domain-containing protein [Nevskiaceae bacterium]
MRLFAALLVAAALAATLPAAYAGPTGEPEPALLARLQKAVADPAGFDDRYVAQVWFVDMAARMQRYVPNALPDPGQRIEFLRVLHAEARRADVSPELVLAVINIESRFERFALSTAGARGYMQIMPFWLKEAGDPGGNLFDLRTNLRMGCTVLRYYLDRSRGDWVEALARYNGSYGRADYPWKVLRALNTRWSPG